ncbi:Peptidyl-prolyl cis-trans isomerase FKBP20-2, chloroplastic [Linum perenne]
MLTTNYQVPPPLTSSSTNACSFFFCFTDGSGSKKRHHMLFRCFNHLNEEDGRRIPMHVVTDTKRLLLRRKFLGVPAASTFFLFQTLPSFGKTKTKSPYDERRLLEQNKRVQRENNAPEEFPNFVREGFEVKVVASDKYVKTESGLIYKDFEVGEGQCPKAGQQVTFHYIGYNESGRRIDSTYLQGSPAKIRLGTNALVPGFEQGISDMRPGGKRRIIIPPELGPPVGPSTFFSAKQFEVFDVELLSIQDCTRRTIAFYSDVVCN